MGRVCGLVMVVATAGAVGWLVTDDAFALRAGGYELNGLRYTDPAMASSAVALPTAGSTNVFLLRTGDMRRRLEALPGIASAGVRVILPNRLVVSITEQAPVLRVRHAGTTYLIDSDGVVLNTTTSDTQQAQALPLIDDRRVELGIPLEVGKAIDETEAAAMLQIGALTPALIGSAAPTLMVSVDDDDGFVVSAGPDAWRAVFGFYTPTLRPPTQIAQQVQCLRSLLSTGEAAIDTIYLAPQDDRCGTYRPRPS